MPKVIPFVPKVSPLPDWKVAIFGWAELVPSPSEKSGCIYSDIDDRKLLGREVVRRGWRKSEVIFCSPFAFFVRHLRFRRRFLETWRFVDVLAGQRLLAWPSLGAQSRMRCDFLFFLGYVLHGLADRLLGSLGWDVSCQSVRFNTLQPVQVGELMLAKDEVDEAGLPHAVHRNDPGLACLARAC